MATITLAELKKLMGIPEETKVNGVQLDLLTQTLTLRLDTDPPEENLE
jgi:hypothetical protein